jgi:hypothetical protein
MGKGARNRAAAAGPATGAAGSSVFPNFPYERRFTKEEIHGDILPRAKRLGDAMRDGVAPSGHILSIPGDMMEMWMIHAALAGCEVHDELAYIRARRLPDATGRFVDSVEWVVKKDDTPEALAEDAEREADRYIKAIDEALRPEVADAIRRKMRARAAEAADYLADAADGAARRDQPRDFGAPRLVEHDPEGEQ